MPGHVADKDKDRHLGHRASALHLPREDAGHRVRHGGGPGEPEHHHQNQTEEHLRYQLLAPDFGLARYLQPDRFRVQDAFPAEEASDEDYHVLHLKERLHQPTFGQRQSQQSPQILL